MSGSTGYGPANRLLFDGDETKYEQWECKMLAYMKIKKLKDVILPVGIASVDRREEAFAELVQFLDDRSLNLIMHDAKDDGRRALEILRQHYAGSGKQRIISLYTTLTSLHKQQTEVLIDYIIRAETASTALKSAGEVISDSLLIAMILKGLPQSYKPFVVVITQTEKVMTFLNFKVAIRNYEENEKASYSNLPNQLDKIMKLGYQNRQDRRGGRSYMSSGAQNFDNNKQNNNKVVCYACGVAGHKSPDCPTKQSSERRDNNKKKWCSYCQSTSHTDKVCRKKKERIDDVKQVRDGKFSPSAEHTFIFGTFDDDSSIDTDAILVDCGATAHIVNELSKFVSFQDDFNPANHTIELADGTKSNVVEKRGTICIKIKNESGDICDVYLEDVLFIPSFPQNIFSVKAAAEKGAQVQLNANDGALINRNGTQFPIYTHGRLYYLKLFGEFGADDSVNSCSSLNSVRSSSLEEWHRILGHVNSNDILKLEGLVSDMKITSKEKFNCDTCTLSKQVVNRNRQPDERATMPLEFVHSDLAGPIEPMAKGNFRYVINFVDDFSGACFVYFLKQKSDAAKALEKFLSDVAPYGNVKHLSLRHVTPDGNTVKRLRTDNGGEFISHEFEEILIRNKIRHEFCAPYSPHQNGTAERNWRTLFGIARGMLIESNLPKFLWTYAVMAAAHIRNRMYCQRIRDTPYHLLTGKQPSISKLHLFGSICFANVHQTKKLDPRCKKGLFIGYDKYSPSYLVFFPESNTVMKNVNVKFTERFVDSVVDCNTRAVLHTGHNTNTRPTFSTDYFSTPFDTVQQLYGGYPENQDDETSDHQEHDTIQPEEDVPFQVAADVPVPAMHETEGVTFTNVPAEETPSTVAEVETTPEKRKYPQRNRVKPKHLEHYCNSTVDVCCKVSSIPLPTTHNQAIHSEEKEEWQKAMESEMNSLRDNNVFTVVPLPAGKKIVGSRWVFSRKSDPDENIIHKARFVAKGFAQVEGSDYTDTFSPTAKMATIRMLIQFAAEHKMLVHQLDVKTAYLNAPIDCEVYVKPPEGFMETAKGGNVQVWRLNKSLYGLKQSGRNWNFVLSDFFRSIGFKQSEVDACLFIKFDKQDMTFVVIWVDDIVVAATSEKLLNATKDLLKQRFQMKDLGEISWFLGIKFHVTSGGISMCQSHYIKGVLERFGMSQCNPRATPCEGKLEQYDNSVNNTAEEVKTYREIVGSLIYAMTCSRPDLAYVVTKLSQSLEKPSETDWITVKHVMKYLKGSMNHKLFYKKSENGLQISGFSDSDWASSHDRRSTTGYCFSLDEQSAIISWKSKKQQTIALSSCEAEYMALTAATQEAMFLSMLAKDFGLTSSEPIHLNGDNQGSLSLVKNPVTNQRSKHIDIKFHFIREKYIKGFIDVTHVPSGDNVSDIMTKPATKAKLNQFRGYLFGHQ